MVVQCLVRELRIRFYSVNTIKNYRSAWVCFLRWYRGPLDQINQEDIREYLERLVNGGASASEVSVTLSALRTGLDKFCLLRCTVGLVSPRKSKSRFKRRVCGDVGRLEGWSIASSAGNASDDAAPRLGF
ncbi:MAG: phage integrase N-terminal SAM-like domain-containing protein, partial [Rhodopirellula sp. JB055]|uniref:phage integrase N-terminal SAM-like domain-containing protein n=1 Tax=Rhodopirellula sp. JB055 TaxID=3342846 RepID=UPI00370CB01E